MHSTMQGSCMMMQTPNLTSSLGRTTSPAMMIGVRDLEIDGTKNPNCWTYVRIPRGRSVQELADLKQVTSLSMVGTIDVKNLRKNTSYGAFLVFKLKPNATGLEKAKALVRFLKDAVERVDYDGLSRTVFIAKKRTSPNEFGHFAHTREDGWMEVQLGEFYNEDGKDGEVQIQLKSNTTDTKRGLTVRGIEVRPIEKE